MMDFTTIYRRHGRLVEDTAARILGNRVHAADVAQTVFMRFWQRPEAFRGGNLEGWLVRVTKNCAIDELRKSRERPTATFETAPSGEAVEPAVMLTLDKGDLMRALRRLPRPQQDAVTLAFLHGLSNRDIARRTLLPLGTVKTRIRSGLRRLRQELDRPAA